MRNHDSLFGLYRPGHSWWHRLGVGWKYLAVLALSLPALILQQPWVSLGLLVASAVALVGTGVPVRIGLAVPWMLVVLLVVLAAFQVLIGAPWLAVVVPANVLLAVFAARLMILTTPAAELIDALVRAAGRLPLVDGERFGLAVGIMLRSVPFLLGAFADVADAARARGLERNWLARLTPVVVRAVGYAQATGEALAARGLGEGEDPRMTA